MGPKDETSAKTAEIGEGLIESLGFEPADSNKFGKGAVADVSDQLSEAGFSVTDVLDGSSDESSPSNGDGTAESKNGSSSENGSDSVAVESDASDFDSSDFDSTDFDPEVRDRADNVDAVASAPESESASASNGSSRANRRSAGSKMAAAATAATAAISAKVGQVERRTAPGDRDRGADQDALEVVPFTPDGKAPTSPPTVEPGPAVTGEIPRVDVDVPVESVPAVVEQQRPVVVDNRTIVDRPRSVSDLFSGGITGRRRLQARKVRRVIRHIDPWSVLTFSVMFHLCLFAALLLASALVFNVAEEAGTIENLESFIRELGDYETFEIDGQAIFKAAVAIAGIMTLAASVLVVLLTVMFNLLSDLLGGVRITVIEEETVRVKPKKSDDE